MEQKHDRDLIQIVAAALAEAARRSGAWLACRPGCCQCCFAPFEINQLDARRLRDGLARLDGTDHGRAERVRERARAAVSRLSADFPGDPLTGLLAGGETEFAQFADAFDSEPCPALDPAQGTCDLYASRPITCRTFGPAVRDPSGSIGICELCYEGASHAEIGECAVEIDIEKLEESLNREAESAAGRQGSTIVAFCLAS